RYRTSLQDARCLRQLGVGLVQPVFRLRETLPETGRFRRKRGGWPHGNAFLAARRYPTARIHIAATAHRGRRLVYENRAAWSYGETVHGWSAPRRHLRLQDPRASQIQNVSHGVRMDYKDGDCTMSLPRSPDVRPEMRAHARARP